MKVLFVASNPTGESALSLEKEINELQTVFAVAKGEPIAFITRPFVTLEMLPSAIIEARPDILHITAHGDTDKLAMRNAAGDSRPLTAEMLIGFLGAHRPQLIYLNACDSHEIADKLSSHVRFAIGNSAPITHRASHPGAFNFYAQLMDGQSVWTAFKAAEQSVASMQAESTLRLACAHGVDPKQAILHPIPQIVARFTQNELMGRDIWKVRVGAAGCPSDTTQVVFFIDDPAYIRNPNEDPACEFCSVSRALPDNGEVWMQQGFYWSADTNLRLFACGVAAEGRTFSIGSTLFEALERHFPRLSRERADLSAVVIQQIRHKQLGI